jgi:hypothetical protein
MLVIRDEQLTKELTEIAEREQRPVEDVLKTMVAHYPTEPFPRAPQSDQSEAMRRVRRKIYDKARRYWEAAADADKAAMTDEEMEIHFGAFDEEGIPRLKHELSSEPPPGSLAYAAMIAARGDFASGNPELAYRAKELLDAHFADDYQKRLRHIR